MKRKMFAGGEKTLFKRASQLRGKQTFGEETLWNFLRTKPFGIKFRRQHVYSVYILDFYCHSLKLVIEVDGSIHKVNEVQENDQVRQQQLESNGLTVLRFCNKELKLQPEVVIEKITLYLQRQIEIRKNSTT